MLVRGSAAANQASIIRPTVVAERRVSLVYSRCGSRHVNVAIRRTEQRWLRRRGTQETEPTRRSASPVLLFGHQWPTSYWSRRETARKCGLGSPTASCGERAAERTGAAIMTAHYTLRNFVRQAVPCPAFPI